MCFWKRTPVRSEFADVHATTRAAALPEPETAPKIMLAATQTMPTPPRSQENRAEQNWMMRLESPPWFMIEPDIIKNGIAISVNELTPLMKPRQFIYIGSPPSPSSTARKPAPSREKVIGTPSSIRRYGFLDSANAGW